MSFLALPELLAGAEEVVGVGTRAVGEAEQVLSSEARIAREAEGIASTSIGSTAGLSSAATVDIEIHGADKAVRDLARISERLENLSPVMHKQITILEEREATMFAGGKYQDTGALMRSLTMSGAPGAVREVTPHGLKFGTSIWYAKYQVRDPGPETDQGGLKRAGHESAVMRKLTPMDAHRIAEESGTYAMHGRI